MKTHMRPRDVERAAFSDWTSPHLETCEACRAQVGRLRLERAAFLRDHPADHFLDRVLARAAPRPWSSHWRTFASALAAVSLVGATLGVWWTQRSPVPEVQPRGSAPFTVRRFISDDGRPAEEATGQLFRPGEVLALEVTVPREGYVRVVNIDEAGRVTLYWPSGTADDGRVRPGTQLLPGAVQLDDVLGDELLVVAYSETALSTDELRREVRRAFDAAHGALQEVAPLVPGATLVLLKHRKVP